MERYWDVTEANRAAMSEDEVRRYLDVELMEHGAVRPAPLQLSEIVEIKMPKVELAVVYSKGKWNQMETVAAFERIEDAKAFLALKPMLPEHDHEADVLTALPMLEAVVKVEDRVPHAAVLGAIVELRGNKVKREANEKAEREYREQTAKIEMATRDLWTDWHKCRQTARDHRKILDTKIEYEKIAGDADTARKFLLKAYTADEIRQALEWENGGPLVAVAEPAPLPVAAVPVDTDQMPL